MYLPIRTLQFYLHKVRNLLSSFEYLAPGQVASRFAVVALQYLAPGEVAWRFAVVALQYLAPGQVA